MIFYKKKNRIIARSYERKGQGDYIFEKGGIIESGTLSPTGLGFVMPGFVASSSCVRRTCAELNRSVKELGDVEIVKGA